MNLRTALAASLLAMMASTAPLSAQDNFRNETVLADFSVENIQPAMRAAGATGMSIDTSNSGSRFLRVTFSDNRIVVATPRACNDAGKNCRGLSIRAFWPKSTSMSVTETRETIEQFNDSAVAGGTLIDEKTVLLSFYIIGDYGMPQGNVRVATQVFLGNLTELRAATE